MTNADGRTDAPLLATLEAGEYELRFAVGDYFGEARRSSTSCRCASASPTRRRTTTCRCSSRPAATARTVAAELAAEVVARCRELARVSDEAGRLTRWFGSPAMARANALVGRWMREAGMAVRVDAAGNLVGHLPGSDPEAGTLLLGSHLDTVRDAGAFDGPLGVLAAIACVARLRAEEVTLPVRGRRARLLRRGGAALRHRLPRQRGGRGDARPGGCSTAPTRTA